MYIIGRISKTRKPYRSITEWSKAIDREINHLRESRRTVLNSLRYSTLTASARYYTDELEEVTNRTSAYYCHLIDELTRRQRLASERHENRKVSRDQHNLYADLIAEFKAFKKFMGGTLRDFIISIRPDGVNRYDMCVTEEKLQQHVRHIEKCGIGITMVRQSGRMYIYRHI